MLFHLMGVGACHTYDHVVHVRPRAFGRFLRLVERALPGVAAITSLPEPVLAQRLAQLKQARTLADFFAAAHATYHAPGDAAATGLPTASVDLVYSHAVLEHVPREVVRAVTLEAKRVLKSTGAAYHLIGLHDHYANFDPRISKVNFLKYSGRVWDFFVKNRISYHNRLREKQFLAVFAECSARVTWLEHETDPKDIEALRGMRVDQEFAGMSPEELAVFRTAVMMTFR